jgi:hypothetical protein
MLAGWTNAAILSDTQPPARRQPEALLIAPSCRISFAAHSGAGVLNLGELAAQG